MGLALVTAPGSEPITTAEAKLHLRVDVATDDALIDVLVQAARELVEGRTNRALVTQTWELTLPCFPAGGIIRLPKPPLDEVTGITYLDANGAEQTLPPDDYVVTTSTLPGQIALAAGAGWPTTAVHPEAVRIAFVCGYGDAADVPKALVAAMKLAIGDLYANREARFVGTIQTDNPAVAALCGPYLYREAV